METSESKTTTAQQEDIMNTINDHRAITAQIHYDQLIRSRQACYDAGVAKPADYVEMNEEIAKAHARLVELLEGTTPA